MTEVLSPKRVAWGWMAVALAVAFGVRADSARRKGTRTWRGRSRSLA